MKRILAKQLLLLLALFFCVSLVQAQNYANTKVDDLTDTQVRQIVERATSIGYSEAQVEQMARAQGMKTEEIQKLKQRIEQLKNKPTQKTSSTPKATEEDFESDRKWESTDLDRTKIDIDKKETDLLNLKPKIFGAELFKNGNITFEPNLRMPTPKGYIIGPDDRLLIDITGDNEASYNLKVSPDGNINLQYIGLIAVNGLSIEQASAKIRTAMSKTYPALRTGRTNLAINLGDIRSIRVTITGQITKPGTYTLPSLATAYNALYASGGPNNKGSFRNIQIIRNNKVVSTIDVYNFLTKGLQQDNIRLQDQDVIHIPVYNKLVEIVGEVKIPALFELKSQDHLSDLLSYAGGFTSEAYTRAIKSLQNTDIERKVSDINATQFNTYTPHNGDKFVVETILDRFQNRVEITGAVFRPGFFELNDQMTLKALIQKAEGLKEDAFMNRGYINRLNLDNTQSLIAFDVKKIMDGTQPDIKLQREDKITISSLFDLRDEYKVSIQGEVRNPGTFNYAEQLSVEDLIQMAGGFKEGATPNRIEIARRLQKTDSTDKSIKTSEIITINVDSKLNLLGQEVFLFPFDIVTIRNAPGYEVQKQVKVEGEVLFPGLYTISNKNERISDLIKRAGGMTDFAYVEGASLKRPGPEKSTKEDKNKIDTQEEEQKKLLGLKRVQETGVKDTLNLEVEAKLIQSDLVGINLEHILKHPQSLNDLILEDGDVIRIPKQLQTVKVTGEVLNPNSVVFSKNKSFIDYVDGAGGFTDKALRKSAYVRYANGSVQSASKFLFFNNYPKIRPGAEIMVPKRAERERMNAQSWIGLGTALASLGAIIVTLLK